MPTPGIEVFLYGSLLDPAVLAARSGRRGLARRAVPALLPGWRRVRLRAGPWPMLLRARGGAVRGLVVRLRGAALRRLVAYEGSAYALRRCTLLRWPGGRPAGRLRAWAWMARPGLAHHGG
ncbi:gamma-glutamylcyclotransferase family protein [Falsiroseomonas selenitidurans]|uniref:Gamma-glutamylcyclotransferase n=1 Tax=Falsiroseomonas selenitidurans TaxID=2716335 RepID=A0ABX1DYA4_9PROT|nr:gamma-glutamylcyclotransferase family protein [Falsiroseomonas selenitidurans]NKC29355.1 gamma-glutamylcyclotransferase [Falsiroseomonas selenitidurans]